MPRVKSAAGRTPMRVPLSILLLLVVARAGAQELEPRAFSPNPVGMNFGLASYGHTRGDVLFDPSTPFEDVNASLDTLIVGYGRTFGIFGRGATAILALPYVAGDVSGNVGEQGRRSVSRHGIADTRLKLSVNLLGGPALTPAQFASRRPGTVVGTSLTVVAPTGPADPDRLINIGTNRWGFKPEVGISQPIGQWFVEGSVGVWLFTDNDNFYGGTHREQDPIVTLQAHVSYTFRPRLWLAANMTYYEGGQSTLDGVPKDDRQSNARVGLTLAVPLSARNSLKLSWSEGATTRIGGDFSSYAVAWQYAWLD